MVKTDNDFLETLKRIHKDFKIIDKKDIVVDNWVRWKCSFGCRAFGRYLNCPPFIFSVEDTKKFLECYEKAIITRFEVDSDFETPPEDLHKFLVEKAKSSCEKMLEFEKKAFCFGYYKAFALYPLSCGYCSVCNAENEVKICENREKIRPSVEAVGIDVFQTARNAGYKIEVLNTSKTKVTLYGILMLE